MAGCCGCCAALKPRYKRLVDSVYPVSAQDGLVKANMDKLTFYAIQSPEKLDKIGQYLEQKLNRDVHRHRTEFVKISVEVLDHLLISCHAQSLNLFVESYLKIIQKLLECEETELQVFATASFVKFANIEEDTPSYHRRYDFFVSKFSSLCHSRQKDWVRLRKAGLSGLQGVVRKTVADELQDNIWDAVHMDKIVPSLLYNMHDPDNPEGGAGSPREEEPSYLAETVFRDLVCRASYGNTQAVLKPVLTHLDNHDLWVPNDFAIKTFKIIMYSVQAQYGYLVVQQLLAHLDVHEKSDPLMKTSIIQVLYEAVLISAGGSIGPSVLDILNKLLRHLRIIVDNKSNKPELRNTEKQLEECVINTIGEFANNLPDYQKIEIMMFVMGKFPQFTSDEDVGAGMDMHLQINLLKTLLKVATKYKTVLFGNAFPPQFLNPLLRMSLLGEPSLRIIVQEILQTMIDRHNNTPKFKRVCIPSDIRELDLTVEKCSRADVLFMRQNGSRFFAHFLENLGNVGNHVENLEALYCTMALIAVETACDDIVVDLFRLALDIQVMAKTQTALPLTHRCAIHGLVAAYFNLLSQLTNIPGLIQYSRQVLDKRRRDAPYLMPDFAYNRTNRPHSRDLQPLGLLSSHKDYPGTEMVREDWLFQQDTLSDLLAANGFDTNRLSTPFSHRPLAKDRMEVTQSASDIGSINIEMESVDGSPSALRRKFSEDEVTVESLKKMLSEDSSVSKEAEERKRLEILETFRKAPFEEIVARSEAKSNHFHNKLSEILDTVAAPDSAETSSTQSQSESQSQSVPVFEMQFPDLFVY